MKQVFVSALKAMKYDTESMQQHLLRLEIGPNLQRKYPKQEKKQCIYFIPPKCTFTHLFSFVGSYRGNGS